MFGQATAYDVSLCQDTASCSLLLIHLAVNATGKMREDSPSAWALPLMWKANKEFLIPFVGAILVVSQWIEDLSLSLSLSLPLSLLLAFQVNKQTNLQKLTMNATTIFSVVLLKSEGKTLRKFLLNSELESKYSKSEIFIKVETYI